MVSPARTEPPTEVQRYEVIGEPGAGKDAKMDL